MPRMTETLPDLLLIGCGKMGGAMLSGWLERGLARAVVVEPFAAAATAFAGRATIVPDAASIPAGFRPAAVILAIKPLEAPATVPAFARFAAEGALFVSIMAGRSVASMRAALGEGAAVVRAMPNTPAAVRQGFTAAFAKDMLLVAAVRADVGAHILDDTQHRYFDFLKHLQAPAGIQQGDVLGRGHDDGAAHRDFLR